MSEASFCFFAFYPDLFLIFLLTSQFHSLPLHTSVVIIEDDTECLMLLMRYPPGVDVKMVVGNALHMWKPKVLPILSYDFFMKTSIY